MLGQPTPMSFQSLQNFAKIGISLTTLITALLFVMGASYYTGFWGYFSLSAIDVSIPFQLFLIPSVSSCIFLYNAILTYSGLQYSFTVKNMSSAVNTESSEPSRVESVVIVVLAICTLGLIGLNIFYWNISGMFTLFGGIFAGTIVALGMQAKIPELRIISVAFAVAICCAHAVFTGYIHAPEAGHKIIVIQKGSVEGPQQYNKVFENSDGIYVVERLVLSDDYAYVVKFISKSEIINYTFKGAFKREPKGEP